MAKVRHQLVLLGLTALMGINLAACGSGSQKTSGEESASPSSAAIQTAGTGASPTASAKPQSRSYTDSKGHTATIPAEPKRVIYTGSDLGDLFALGVKPVGAALGIIGNQIAYPELLEGIQDVGDVQGDLEKILSLNPDLILMDSGGSYYEEGGYEALSKIAPTVTYERLSTNERLLALGEILGKKQQAEKWIADFGVKAAEVRKKLGTGSGETATVFLQLGKDMYVMGNKALAATLYETLGFKPAPKVKQELIDKNEAFANISIELLPEFAGDWLFVLTDESVQARTAKDSFASSAWFNSIPAVKNKKVSYVPTKWNFDDPITKERLLDALPAMLNQ